MNTYIQKIREISLDNKYTKWYCNIVEKALLRPQDRKHLKTIYGYVESHHILPKCFELGGKKDKENLVFLTGKEHFIAHLCATKMFISHFKNKMNFAFHQLKSSNKFQNRYTNARLYALIKPNFNSYNRIYKLDKVKYVAKGMDEELDKWLSDGWSLKMTPEFKVGRVGQMKGRKHSEESIIKMRIAQKGKLKLSLRGIPKSQESIERMKTTRENNKKQDPDFYKESIESGADKRRDLHREGILNVSGEKNPMFGKSQKESTKNLISQKTKNRWDKIKNSPDEYDRITKKYSVSGKKSWENLDRRQKSKIFNSKSYQKYGIIPQELYDKRLKPLLYLGFLPTSIVRYNLIDFSKGSIKRLIYEFGTTEDKDQFELNKKNSAGASKKYIQFLEEQYNKYFKDKNIEEVLLELNNYSNENGHIAPVRDLSPIEWQPTVN